MGLLDGEAGLRSAVTDGRALVMAGTGVSIAASVDPATKKPHPQASWVGLLRSGLDWLRAHDLVSETKAGAHLSLMEDGATHNFISAAQDITRLMGGTDSVHFRQWLEETVGSVRAHDCAALEALNALRAHGNVLATTNYDSLLLDDAGEIAPVVWEDADAFLQAMRNPATHSVFFLHGHWRKPSSVVLDWSSYERISREDRYRNDLAALWHTRTWVYVGCGINGLSDPDLGLLLERYGSRGRRADLRDYCLVRRDQREEFQAHFDERNINIVAVPFGTSHSDLPAFLRSLLPAPPTPPRTSVTVPTSDKAGSPAAPQPPALYAVPDYIGSHEFVGRTAQLGELDDWARAADPANLLLFEAIGGTGKSMLTWRWVNEHAPVVRADWAGRLWYSFYERGAVMADFCRHALAYITAQPLESLAGKRTAELAEELLAHLHAKPWLVVLDGLERVLVAYHRLDAAQVPDEQVDTPTDAVLHHREPTATIRDEDGDLLRNLAAARPSKIIVTSRLTPRVLLNPAGQAIPGVKRLLLPGLRPEEAEALLRAGGVHGDPEHIQRYLTENCDNHPLVVGALAGLIVSYLPDRGNFDAWAADPRPRGGARLNLAALDLVGRRNHILRAALDDLPDTGRALLSTLALLSEAVDYDTLVTFNPHQPPEPEPVAQPKPPESTFEWKFGGEKGKAHARQAYETALARRAAYEQELHAWQNSDKVRQAQAQLSDTVTDLERRGLLQYDHSTRRYDLHPVVRGVAAGALQDTDLVRYGERVVDHFTAVPHPPYERAQTLEDVAAGLQVVHTLLKLERSEQAAQVYLSGLANALLRSLEAHPESLAVLRPFFPAGWDQLPGGIPADLSSMLANYAGNVLFGCGELQSALEAYTAGLHWCLAQDDWSRLGVDLRNIGNIFYERDELARSWRIRTLALELAEALGSPFDVFKSLLDLFDISCTIGQFESGWETWQRLDSMGRDWHHEIYRPGSAEVSLVLARLHEGTLREKHIATAERLAQRGINRIALRNLHLLRGEWCLARRQWAPAAASFEESGRMARERGLTASRSEVGLALAKLHLRRLSVDQAREEARRLNEHPKRHHRYLAMLWHAVGDNEHAAAEALAAYNNAWGDGEPYVRRYEQTKAVRLLEEMGVPVPDLPPYDPDTDEPAVWEADIRAGIDKARREKEIDTERNARTADHQQPSSPSPDQQ